MGTRPQIKNQSHQGDKWGLSLQLSRACLSLLTSPTLTTYTPTRLASAVTATFTQRQVDTVYTKTTV